MEIDEHPVPDAIVTAFCRLVDRLDAKRILGTASVMPAIFQGHRVIAQNVPVARQRIKSLLKSERHLDTYTATLLRGTGLASEFVVVLSEAALREGFRIGPAILARLTSWQQRYSMNVKRYETWRMSSLMGGTVKTPARRGARRLLNRFAPHLRRCWKT